MGSIYFNCVFSAKIPFEKKVFKFAGSKTVKGRYIVQGAADAVLQTSLLAGCGTVAVHMCEVWRVMSVSCILHPQGCCEGPVR